MKKVSIITPVYNGERFIEQYMKSVLEQKYENIELIIVNDGSTDKTDIKIIDYEKKLREKGIQFHYIKKKNGGQASAINEGLKKITGDYVTWPDIDDRMHNDYVEKKVNFMESHPKVDYLITQSAIINIDRPDAILGYTWNIPPKSNVDILYRIVNDRQYWYEPGNFFVSKKILDRAIPERQIYDLCGKWSGPQIQIMLPIIFYGQFGYLPECLYDYIIHNNNDHNKYKEKRDLVIKYNEGRKVLKNTIMSLQTTNEKKEELIRLAEIRMSRIGMRDAFNHMDYGWYKNEIKKIPKTEITIKDLIKELILKYDFFKWLYDINKDIVVK